MADQEVNIWLRLKDEVSDGLNNLSKGFSSFFEQLTGTGMLAIGSVAGAFLALKDAITRAGDAQATMAETTRITTEVGTAAGWSSTQIKAMADKIGDLVGVQGDEIQAGINLLAVHTNLSDQSMPKVAMAAADLAAHMNGGKLTAENYKATIELLAGALENPQRGMMMLQRELGGLDDAQKENIKTLIANGQLEQARALILDAVIAKTKGAAEQTGTWDYTVRQAQKAVADLAETLGKFLLPILTMLVEALTATVKTVGNVSTALWDFALIVSDVFTHNLKAIQKHHEDMTKHAVGIVTDWKKAGHDIAASWDSMLKQMTGDEKKAQDERVKIVKKSEATVTGITQDEINARMEANKTAYEAAKAKADKYYADLEMMQRASIENEVMRERERQQLLGDLAQLQHSKNQVLWEIGKQASAAQAGISAAEGAVKAYDSMVGVPIVGPVLGAAAAAALLIYGAEQVSNIESQSFPAAANQAYAPGDGATIRVGEANNPEWIMHQGGIKKLVQAAQPTVNAYFLPSRRHVEAFTVTSQQSQFRLKKEGRIH